MIRDILGFYLLITPLVLIIALSDGSSTISWYIRVLLSYLGMTLVGLCLLGGIVLLK